MSITLLHSPFHLCTVPSDLIFLTLSERAFFVCFFIIQMCCNNVFTKYLTFTYHAMIAGVVTCFIYTCAQLAWDMDSTPEKRASALSIRETI